MSDEIKEEVKEEVKEFNPITSQEQFDKAIGARLYEERQKYEGFNEYKDKAEKYEEAISKLNAKDAEIESLNKELDAFHMKAKLSEIKEQVSKEFGVPTNLLKGSNEEEIKLHAESLKEFISKNAAPVIKTDGFYAGDKVRGEAAEAAHNLFNG